MFLLQATACSGNVLDLKKEKIKYKSVYSAVEADLRVTTAELVYKLTTQHQFLYYNLG
jgi:hypothetical protein